MDDDLLSLRDSGSSPAGGGGSSSPQDNPLGFDLDDLGPPVAAAAPAAAAPAPVSKKAAPPAPKKKKAAPRRSTGGGGFMGMTPQQGMLLSVFLFLDVAVLGCLVLIALGALKLPAF